MTTVYVFYKRSIFNIELLGDLNMLYEGFNFEFIDIESEPSFIKNIKTSTLGKTLVISPLTSDVYSGIVNQFWDKKKDNFKSILFFTGLSEEWIVDIIQKFNIFPFYLNKIDMYSIDMLFELHLIHIMSGLN